MTLRRSFGMFTLLAMMHFIIVGTAAACVAPHGVDPSVASSAHTECAPAPSHSKRGTERPAEVPCCAALASCATAPLMAGTLLPASTAPSHAVASALAERAPSAEAPAPELPPPRA